MQPVPPTAALAITSSLYQPITFSTAGWYDEPHHQQYNQDAECTCWCKTIKHKNTTAPKTQKQPPSKTNPPPPKIPPFLNVK